jgi:hypothetical protein
MAPIERGVLTRQTFRKPASRAVGASENIVEL